MNSLRVRRATEDDAARIASFVATETDLSQVSPTESFPLTADVVRQWLFERSSGYVLVEHDDIVAYAELNPDAARRKTFWIGHLVVDPKRRGRQFGQSLVQGLCRVARQHQQAREVWISAFEENRAAVLCYEAAGFRQLQRRRVDSRTLIDLKRRVDGDRRVFTRSGLMIYAACAGPLTISILPGDTRAALSAEHGALQALAFLIAAILLTVGGALASYWILPRRDERGVMRLLKPVLHAVGAALITGILWGIGYGLFGDWSQVSFPGILAFAPQYGAGWGVLSSFMAQFLASR